MFPFIWLIAIVSGQQPVTLNFCNNSSYSGCVDTEVWELSPNKVMESLDVVTTDSNNDGGESQILMRFEDIIGAVPGRIPPHSRVRSASLIVTAFDPGTTVNLHRMLVPWHRAATWNNLISGISADGLEATRHRESFTFGKITANKQKVRFEVTDTVQAWVNGRPNHGWVFLNTGANDLIQVFVSSLLVGLVFFVLTADLAVLAILPIPLILVGAFWFQRRLAPRYAAAREAARNP